MGDLISRQAAIDKFEPWLKVPGYSEGELNMLKAVLYELRHLPSAERRGRWEDVEHAPNGLLYATCSVCGKRQAVECTNYCGNCGARMEASE